MIGRGGTGQTSLSTPARVSTKPLAFPMSHTLLKLSKNDSEALTNTSHQQSAPGKLKSDSLSKQSRNPNEVHGVVEGLEPFDGQ